MGAGRPTGERLRLGLLRQSGVGGGWIQGVSECQDAGCHIRQGAIAASFTSGSRTAAAPAWPPPH